MFKLIVTKKLYKICLDFKNRHLHMLLHTMTHMNRGILFHDSYETIKFDVTSGMWKKA